MRCALILWLLGPITAAQDQPRPVSKIQPGQVIVPPDRMRRIWGELVSVDLKTRTGTFRNESTDELMPFTVLPYAELLHHAAFGDLEDFRVGERAIFRMHEDREGKWTWLTYIQDEMNFLNGHKEYYWVERLDAGQGTLEFTQANADKSFVREKGLVLHTDASTRYWNQGQPARFADIKVGDRLRTKTHGVGKGKVRVCWEVFLDDESLLRFQAEQQEVHRRRMTEQGLPGYIDSNENKVIRLTLFQEGRELAQKMKRGQEVRLAIAGVDRRPTGAPLNAVLTEMKAAGNLYKVSVTLSSEAGQGFAPGAVARLWTSR